MANLDHIEVIKALRQLVPLGLRDAKELVETPAALLIDGVDGVVARDAKTRLEGAGTVISLV